MARTSSAKTRAAALALAGRRGIVLADHDRDIRRPAEADSISAFIGSSCGDLQLFGDLLASGLWPGLNITTLFSTGWAVLPRAPSLKPLRSTLSP